MTEASTTPKQASTSAEHASTSPEQASTTPKSRGGRWPLIITVIVAVALLAWWVWMTFMSPSARVSNAVEQLSGVESVTTSSEDSGQRADVKVSLEASEEELQAILDASENLIADGVVPAVDVAYGRAVAQLTNDSSSYRGDARPLRALASAPQNAYISQDKVTTKSDRWCSLDDWLELFRDDSVGSLSLTIVAEGFCKIEVTDPRFVPKGATAVMSDWSASIAEMRLSPNDVYVISNLPTKGIGELATDLEALVNDVGDEYSFQLDSNTDASIRGTAPSAGAGDAVEAAARLERSGFEVGAVETDLSWVVLRSEDRENFEVPSRSAMTELRDLPNDLADAGVRPDASLRFEGAPGVGFDGTLPQLQANVSQFSQAANSNYLINMELRGSPPAITVTTPEMDEWPANEEMKKAIALVRSLSWEGEVTLRFFNESVEFSSSVTGKATDPVSFDEDQEDADALAALWDATATGP